jgi:hypothetical protein
MITISGDVRDSLASDRHAKAAHPRFEWRAVLLKWNAAKGASNVNSDDKFVKAMLEAPVSAGRHETQFKFVVADGIARRAPWLTTREIVRDANAMVRIALEYAMGVDR